ncbi:AraC family transcriptional regulator [Vallitalea okinawensis]|uniref:AraC family transcriptional regulator n=1 Tax=Vallitalea okinawensis TaxID=2078660 RepID=UPI0013009FDB|nr:AraC family transcriptional regulator [Vallitalea okinawensis]
MINSLTEIQMTIELFWLATGLPIRLYNEEKLLITEKLLPSQQSIYGKCFDEVLEHFFSYSKDIQFYTNLFAEHYIYQNFTFQDKTYHLVCGPAISHNYDDQFIMQTLENEQVSFAKLQTLRLYFNSLPKYSSIAMRKIQPLLYHQLTGNYMTLDDLFKRESILDKIEFQNTSTTDSLGYHHSSIKSYLIHDAIKNADREALHEILLLPDDGPFGILCKNNPLRSYKNLFITTVTETTLAAISGGVDSESAYTLSDTFIQFVEEVETYEEVTDLFIDMLNAFIDLVEKSKRLTYSKPVYLTVDYINKYYSQRIRISELAAKVHLSESHLLRLFKSQLGVSIKDYITQTRIDKGKKLLKYTQYSIATISNMTGFNDQSHFTRMFKKQTQLTPKAYRESIQVI